MNKLPILEKEYYILQVNKEEGINFPSSLF